MLPKRLKLYQAAYNIDFSARANNYKDLLFASTGINSSSGCTSGCSSGCSSGSTVDTVFGFLNMGLNAGLAIWLGSSSQKASKSATTNSAKAQVDICNKQISELADNMKKQFGVEVDKKTGSAKSLAEIQTDLQTKIDNLKKEAGITKEKPTNEVVENYRKAVEDCKSLKDDESTSKTLDSKIANFDTGKETMTNKSLITINGDKATATIFKAEDFKVYYSDKSGKYVNDGEAQAKSKADEANQSAISKAKEYNDIVSERQTLWKRTGVSSTADYADKIATAEAKVNECDKQINGDNSSNASKYTAEIDALESQLSNVKSGSSQYATDLAQIKVLISTRDSAQKVLDANDDVAAAKRGVKNTKGNKDAHSAAKNARTEAVNNQNLAIEMFLKQMGQV